MKILEENSINETNTSRIYQHIKGGDNFAIISAYISDNSVPKSQNERDNRSRTVSLKNEVYNKLGFGYIRVQSRWVEFDKQENKNVSSDEMALFIIGIPFEKAFELGQKYGQHSIIYKDENGCREICTIEFAKDEHSNYKVGEVVRVFNIDTNNILNIRDAQEIFANRVAGPSSRPFGNSRAFTLKTKDSVEEDVEFQLYEIYEESPSYFQTEPTKIRVI